MEDPKAEEQQKSERKIEKESIKDDDFENDPLSIQRRLLPIFPHREEILAALAKHNILIIVGETGSGKSTQIAQYCEEEGWAKKDKIIGITQPRRVGAVSLAHRVAEESNCNLGEEVGYSVRFSDKTSSSTRIKYMTDGVLLRECLLDPDLKQYSVIILDEAHERSVNTDILFGLMKKSIIRRPELKVLITSATLDSEKFSKFFNNCPVFFVPGRSYPVDIFHMEQSNVRPDYVDSAVDTVMKIHESEPEGDILLFLTGQQEITKAVKILETKIDALLKKKPHLLDLIPLPLYAALPPSEQVRVFQPTPPKCRKVVVATNIAETSLTVNGIVYVIDPGYVKQKNFNPNTGMESLQVTLISQVAAQQRAGRGGRTRPGKCYRLYSKETYDKMEQVTVPEIQRTNLANVVLTLKAMGIHDVLGFDFLDPPDPFLLVQALKQLFYLEALDEEGKITEIGKKMSYFPLEPAYSRMVLASIPLRCLDEVVTMISMLSIENLFYRPSDKEHQAECDENRRELYQEMDEQLDIALTGDHFFLIYLFDEWMKSRKSHEWCRKYWIQPRHLEEAAEIKKQILDIIKEEKLDRNSKSERENLSRNERIAKSVCHGCFMNAANRVGNPTRKDASGDYTYHIIHQGIVASVHPQSSIYFSAKEAPSHLVFAELVSTTRPFLRNVLSVKFSWIEPLLQRRTKLDVDKLIGHDFQEVLRQSMDQKEEIEMERKGINKRAIQESLIHKFARKNDDQSIQSAKDRYLQRKAEKEQQKKKK